jgi:hypothetical protein
VTERAGRSGLILFVGAILVGSYAAINADITPGVVTGFTAVSVLAIIVGEQVPLVVAGRAIAPLTTAPALGLVLAAASGTVIDGWTVLAIVWLSILMGGLLVRARGGSVVEGSLGARFLGMAVTTYLAHSPSFRGDNLVEWTFDPANSPSMGALGMFAVALAGGLVERLLETLVLWLGEKQPLARVLTDETGPLAGIGGATITTGPLIALASPYLGWAAIPLLIIPVVLTHVAVRRVIGIRDALEQSMLAMSRLSEVAGLTRPGHSQRVARLAVAIGRRLEMDIADLRLVERTALLHDLGQLGLAEPLRGGATIHATAIQEAQIAYSARRLVGGTPQLAELLPLLDQVRTPFRRTREFGEHIPIASRIVRVANAWDDINEGARSPRAQAVALERLHLGLGYDYDPEVVAALEQAVMEHTV